MAKLKHAKRSRPRPMPTRRHRSIVARQVERRTRLDLERWRRDTSPSA
ncbi:MAG: hypothetical protein ACR2KI_05750 [Candidatus Limnocylindria bacterium]